MTGLEKGDTYTKEAKKELDKLEGRIDQMQARQTDARQKSGLPEKGGDQEMDWDQVFQDMKARAAELGRNIETLSTELRNMDWNEVGQRVDDYRKSSEKRLKEWRKTSEEWRKTGEEQWHELEKRFSDLQARTEDGFWELRAMVQRLNEGVQPYLNRDAEAKPPRYFLQKGPGGRWSLMLDGADAPTMVFDSKQEGLKAGRRYVRDRAPSELVVRRSNGTFEHVHKYRA